MISFKKEKLPLKINFQDELLKEGFQQVELRKKDILKV